MDLVIPRSPGKCGAPWSEPDDAEIRTFQANNGLVVDGLVGPKTIGACWRPIGSRQYTHLAPYLRSQGSDASRRYLRHDLDDAGPRHPLAGQHLETLAELLSGDWTTGFDYCSTQDGATMGFRRYAGRTLRALLERFGTGLRGKLPQKNNGWPLSEPAARKQLLDLAQDKTWWQAQLSKWYADLRVHLILHRFSRGREIALYERAANSAPGWVAGCSSYAELRRAYLRHPRGRSRVSRIEAKIGPGDHWR